jgi:hypothetical protein
MSVDVRTRFDLDQRQFDAALFLAEELPAALDANAELVIPGAQGLGLRPLTIDLGERVWTLAWEQGRVVIREGRGAASARVLFSEGDLGDLIQDQRTPVGFFIGGDLEMPEGNVGNLLDWWLVLRSALDGRPIYTPGSIRFRDRDGSSLDLERSFRLDESPEEMLHFLREAGFLHLRDVFSEDEMAEVSADMDRSVGDYAPGDGNSWWAKTADGTDRLVRMQGFDNRSAITASLVEDDRFQRIGQIPGDGHRFGVRTGNRLEALIKPVGVVEGISDVPWHRDCSIGRHSYDCCNMTTGISVTGAGPQSGQLRVHAGSNRALTWPSLLKPGSLDLPDLALPTETGDVTVHLSCTLHMAQPPEVRERRVLYTSFSLPARDPEAVARARARLGLVREHASRNVSQEPSHVVAGGSGDAS